MQVKSIKDVLSNRNADKGKYLKHEWQDFGYRLAVELRDLKHRSLYMKFAKTEKRHILETALAFAKDYDSGRAKLFMWKLKKIREEEKNEQNIA